MKRCAKCTLTLALENFPNSKGRRDGKNPYCKACCNQDNRERYSNNREVEFFRAIKKRYGFTKEQWISKYEECGGVCFICERQTLLVVDHHHTTGRFRGLLCRTCNGVLGRFCDDPQRFVNASVYLTTFNTKLRKQVL